jgi:transcriptional regulator with XRE-family HTH domain
MESESDALPQREITVNQIAAWWLAHYRKTAGLKQDELGERLGWSRNKVSEAERSWDSGRTREFNAHELAGIALALGVPVAALLLPPPDDRRGIEYITRPPGREKPVPMAELLEYAVMPDSDLENDSITDYRQRLRSATARYLDASWRATVEEWLEPLDERARMAERAARLRARADVMQEIVDEDREAADAIDPEGAQ